ncbi:hypothetical protein F383_37725 [Gossypium arboreum]|uniref:Uncharacterized protein n=1 Tax=Gossypium arboreum TaxID=29729 RepID=A0A0B0MDK7_GOSAR|nr:hypothetical protein F383_37725 [Gossypium arboreum]
MDLARTSNLIRV